MLPFLVLELIGLVILVAVVFIYGIIATVNSWAMGLITLVIGSTVVGKCYYSHCPGREGGEKCVQ
jgi:hypothetical protein